MSWILDLSYLSFILLEDFYLPPQQAAGMNVLFIIVENGFFFCCFFYSSWTTCTIIFFAPVLGCMIILGVFFLFLFEAHLFVGVPRHDDWIEIYQCSPVLLQICIGLC